MKVYVVLNGTVVEKAFTDKWDAHSWAELKFGTKIDGICVDGVNVQAIELIND